MWYACIGQATMQRVGSSAHFYKRVQVKPPCGHRERYWNSRDGVTPFGTSCPSCGGDMQHVEFGRDEYAPEHVPHTGQRMWISMTRERAEKLADQRIAYFRALGRDIEDSRRASLIESFFKNGDEPDLRISGYTEVL